MNKQYAVLNPADGTYTRVGSRDEAIAEGAKHAISFYFSHTHGSPITVVEIKSDGVETWRNPFGEEIVAPEEFDSDACVSLTTALSMAEALPLPVTKL